MRCETLGISVQLAGVFASGLLVGGSTYCYCDASVEIIDKKNRWENHACSYGFSLPVVALSFCLLPKIVSRIAIGVKNAQEVHAAVEWCTQACSTRQEGQDEQHLVKVIPGEFWRSAVRLGLLSLPIELFDSL